MFNIGIGEMTLILVAALLVMGPDRLPEFARTLGKFMREFRRQTDDVRGVVMRELYKLEQEVDLEDRNPKKAKPLPATSAVGEAVPMVTPGEATPAAALASAAQAADPAAAASSPAPTAPDAASSDAPDDHDPNVTVVDGIRIAPAAGTVARGSIRPPAPVAAPAAAPTPEATAAPEAPATPPTSQS